MNINGPLCKNVMKIMKTQDIKHNLLLQGFSKRLGVDYKEMYSLVMDAITFWYLISLIVFEDDMHVIDVFYDLFIWIYRYQHIYKNP